MALTGTDKPTGSFLEKLRENAVSRKHVKASQKAYDEGKTTSLPELEDHVRRNRRSCDATVPRGPATKI